MPDIDIFLDDCAFGANNDVRVSGRAIVEGATELVTWYVDLAFSALATTKNTAIKNAAIQAASDQLSITVGALDKKTLYSGAIGL